jgi:hypothetical protein
VQSSSDLPGLQACTLPHRYPQLSATWQPLSGIVRYNSYTHIPSASFAILLTLPILTFMYCTHNILLQGYYSVHNLCIISQKKAIFIIQPLSHETINTVFHISHKLHNSLYWNFIYPTNILLTYFMQHIHWASPKANQFSASQEIPWILLVHCGVYKIPPPIPV